MASGVAQEGGSYPDQGSCEAACNPSPSPAFSCHTDGTCVEDAGGRFSNEDECKSQCAPDPTPSRFRCNAGTKTCSPDAGGVQWPDQSACDADCAAPNPGPSHKGKGSNGQGGALSTGTKMLLVFFFAMVRARSWV